MPQIDVRRRKVGHKVLMRAAAGTALAGLVMCANVGAARAGDDEPSMYDRILGVIGVRNPGSDSDAIDYSERSPLVVPPTRDLPRPATSATPAPGWPKDPDMQRRLRAKEDKKVRPHADYVIESARPLRPDELNVPGANTNASSTAQTGSTQPAAPVTRKKSIFSFDYWHKEEYATFTGEPPRTSLTEPPPGYQTPSPDQPYGVSPDKKKYEIPTLASRMEAPR